MTTIAVRHRIGGDWTGEPTEERRNPARQDEVVAAFPSGSGADVERGVAAAVEAAGGWARTPAPVRGVVITRAAAILESRAEAVARDLTREEGKTLAESLGEVRRAVDILRYYGGEGWRFTGETVPSGNQDVLLYTKREPLGVVAIITPWNFPIAIPAWKIAPALVAGNAVVFKPATLTPLSAFDLVLALLEAGLPDGVLNLVYGSGARVGDALVGHPAVAAVSFTGSTAVGSHINALAGPRMARLQLEMGGKNPLIVAEDASPTVAAGIAAAGGFGLTGQACTATSRVIAVGKVAAPLIEALMAEVSRRVPGDGLDRDAKMGPVVSEAQLRTDLDYLRIGAAQGARLVAGGVHRDGLFLEPALFADVRPEHRIAREEIFGPVIGVIAVDNIDEAVAVANDTEYGLAAAICTNDLRLAHHFADRIQVGVVKINQPTTGLELQMPFGGIKASSAGAFKEQGRAAIEFYSRVKAVYLNYGS
jgi:alpha-ketoglutaric semialdehyde dehydrogenase